MQESYLGDINEEGSNEKDSSDSIVESEIGSELGERSEPESGIDPEAEEKADS